MVEETIQESWNKIVSHYFQISNQPKSWFIKIIELISNNLQSNPVTFDPIAQTNWYLPLINSKIFTLCLPRYPPINWKLTISGTRVTASSTRHCVKRISCYFVYQKRRHYNTVPAPFAIIRTHRRILCSSHSTTLHTPKTTNLPRNNNGYTVPIVPCAYKRVHTILTGSFARHTGV